MCMAITPAALFLPAQDNLPDPRSLSLVNCQTHFLCPRRLPRPSDPPCSSLLSITQHCWDPALRSEFITHFLCEQTGRT